ncbi:4-hydroxybutyrate CoA-transferase, partial [bacterium]
MNWRDHFNGRTVTAPEAVTKIKSGDRVVVAHACGEPKSLVEAMVDR